MGDHLGSFLTTYTCSRMAKVNRETRQKATDETFGVFRRFTITADEINSYKRIQKLDDLRHLSKIQTADVPPFDILPCVSEFLEESRATLKELRVWENWSCDRHIPTQRSPGDPIPFPRLTDMDIQDHASVEHVSERRWAFPALRSLRADSVSSSEDAEPLARLVERSPKIERLEASHIEFITGAWASFNTALSGCPHITTITGIAFEPDEIDRVSQLKETLNQHWAKPESKDVGKKLGLVLKFASIDVSFGQGAAAAGAEGINKWAAEVNCQVEWRPNRGELSINCSWEGANALPAPGGPYSEIVTQLPAEATEVELELGGMALHPSWRDKLVFPKAKTLVIKADSSVTATRLVDSIPEWMTEREGGGQTAPSRSFPHVEQLSVEVTAHFSLSGLPSAPSKLSPRRGLDETQGSLFSLSA